MDRKKKIMVLTITICIIGLIILFLWTHIGGDISNVNRTMNQSEVYSEQDIFDAMDIIERQFKINFSGCTLTDLWYDEDVSITSSHDWAKQCDADEAIVLLSNFKVDSSGGDGSLSPDETYTNWQWILVRDKGSSKWKLITWGY